MARMTIILLVSLSLINCGVFERYAIEKPEGFAEIRSRNSYKAISPEGVLFELRIERNSPRKNLDFWTPALERHMIDRGYALLEPAETIETDRWPGSVHEWGAPVGTQDYVYLTAVFPARKRIYILEAAAEQSLYMKYRNELKTSIETFRIR